jgi:hypothetical protein
MAAIRILLLVLYVAAFSAIVIVALMMAVRTFM